jgi:alpha-glucoside transport system substrate-binding protein
MKKLLTLVLLAVFVTVPVLGRFGTQPKAAAQEKRIEITSPWGESTEGEALLKVLAAFTEKTGIQIDHNGSRDLVAEMTARAEAGNPPDFMISPLPAVVEEFAANGYLVPLDSFLDMTQIQAAFAPDWLKLGSYEDHLYGIWGETAPKSLVWYNPAIFAAKGYTVPTTWDEMMALTEQMAADGLTPWSIAMESGAATGWVGTDWIEDIMLRTVGPDVYDQWVNHEIPWTDERVKNAWEIFGKIGLNEKYVFGGTTGELTVFFGDGADALYTDPANAYMHRMALFIYGYIKDHFPDIEPLTQVDFFQLPPIDPQFGNPVLTSGSQLVMFKDTPENRQFMEFWASEEAQSLIVASFNRLSASSEVPLETYSDPLLQKAAQIQTSATSIRFDGSDLMPSAIGAGAFWTGVVDYVSGADLDTVLETIEEAAVDAYSE